MGGNFPRGNFSSFFRDHSHNKNYHHLNHTNMQQHSFGGGWPRALTQVATSPPKQQQQQHRRQQHQHSPAGDRLRTLTQPASARRRTSRALGKPAIVSCYCPPARLSLSQYFSVVNGEGSAVAGAVPADRTRQSRRFYTCGFSVWHIALSHPLPLGNPPLPHHHHHHLPAPFSAPKHLSALSLVNLTTLVPGNLGQRVMSQLHNVLPFL